MSFLDWMDIASSFARLIGFIASPICVFFSLKHWVNKDQLRAIYFIAWAILLVRP